MKHERIRSSHRDGFSKYLFFFPGATYLQFSKRVSGSVQTCFFPGGSSYLFVKQTRFFQEGLYIYIYMAVINNNFVSRHPTDRSFFSKTRTFLSRAVGKITGNQITGIHFFAGMWFWHMEYPKWQRQMNMTMNFIMLSQRIFLLLQAQSHANWLAGAYSRGYGALIELIKK